MRYEPEVKEIEKEEDIVKLVREVKRNLGSVDCRFNDASLLDVVSVIDRGSYNHILRLLDSVVRNEIDLSVPQRMISNYRNLSGDGCRSCESYGSARISEDEGCEFCRRYEPGFPRTREAGLFGMSERIKKYSEKGCSDMKPVFRKLEEVLK